MISRSITKAKEAYKTKDIKATIAAHNVKAKSKVDSDEGHIGSGQYIKSAVYGGLDGTVTTFAVVAGSQGASLTTGVVLILGFANLIGDGLSMAIGDYLSTKSENEYHNAERAREKWEVENYPQGEKKEMVELYESKGIAKKDATSMVEIMAKYKEAWVDLMMVEELGIMQSKESPMKNAVVTFLSFVIFGFIPLLTYVLSSSFIFLHTHTFLIATLLTILTLFCLGAMRIKFTGLNLFRSGMEMVIVGGIASFAAYLIGYFLQSLA
jgi:vacuolar iron transporter family protein